MNTYIYKSLEKMAIATTGLALLTLLGASPAASQDVGGLELLERLGRYEGKLRTHFAAVPTAADLDARARKTLEETALTCPVHRSLRADVAIPVPFHRTADAGRTAG